MCVRMRTAFVLLHLIADKPVNYLCLKCRMIVSLRIEVVIFTYFVRLINVMRILKWS